MKNNKTSKLISVIFVVIALLSLCEYIFIRGMFTWLISLISVAIMGIVNIIFQAKEKNWLGTILTIIVVLIITALYLSNIS